MEQLRESRQIQIEILAAVESDSVRILENDRDFCRALKVINQKGEVYRADAFGKNVQPEAVLNSRIFAAGFPEGL